MAPVYLSARRFLCVVNGNQLHEFAVKGTGITSEQIVFESPTEVPVDSSFQQEYNAWSYNVSYQQIPGSAFFNPGLNRLIDKGRLYTFERANSAGLNFLITTVKRYAVGTVKP